jgi:hypothetical protein
MKTLQDLKSVQAQAILRINCPGYGQVSGLSSGSARPLIEYKVIVVNPLSILHLFDGPSEILRQIDLVISDGVSSCKLADDELINKISAEIEIRSSELIHFLKAGGLLIYYLCRPFVLIGENKSLDNYAWLGGLVPDQPGQSTMGEHTVRHMSAAAHGRNIDKTAEASNSGFGKYFDQSGLEWNTIIRTDYLSEGYTALALAGPKKCISAQLLVGDSGGQVVFLPAPYSPDFDRTLMECVDPWYSKNPTGDSATIVEGQKAPLGTDDNKEEAEAGINTETPTLQQRFTNALQAKVTRVKPEEQIIAPLSQAKLPARTEQEQEQEQKQKQELTNWATHYLLPGVDQLSQETEAIRGQVEELEKQIAKNEDTIYFLEAVKVPLLTGAGENLLESCKSILESFGWVSEERVANPNELILSRDGNPAALVHIAVSNEQIERAELAQLVESLIAFWNSEGRELKGILVACNYADTPLTQRTEPDFPESVIEYAGRKNICLITTVQLLYMYRDFKLLKVQADAMRQVIFSSQGCLPGFAS